MRFLLIASAVLALAACHKPAQPAGNQNAPAAEAGPHQGLDRSHKGQGISGVKILDASGKKVPLLSLAGGKPLLLNLWASWCAPCVKELPTLQKLRDQRGAAITVLPVSQDDGPQASVKAFLADHKLTFAPYQDPKTDLSFALGPDTVLPTSILYDANGKEIWRYVGDRDWTSPEAAKLLSEASGASARG